jgi:hypothetical protein
MKKLIRSSQHFYDKIANTGKTNKAGEFIDEYRRVASLMLDQIFENGYTWEYEDKKTNEIKHCVFSIKDDLLDCPSYLDYNLFKIDSTLSARALSSLGTQLCGVIGAATEKRKKRLYVFNQLCLEGKYNEKLCKILERFPVVKPNVENLNPELSSKCVDFEKSDNDLFLGYVRLKSIGEGFGHIKIPIRNTNISRKYKKDWNMLPSILLTKSFINVRWEKEIELKKEGKEIGCDQGKLTVLTLSDKQTTPKENNHKHSLDSIMLKLSNKKKGSKAFKKAQDHRKNFINWSVNQINLTGISHFKLEEVINIGFKNPKSRLMSHWTNTLIRDKTQSKCDVNGVRFTLQSCTYRSQRCSACGLVRKSNRKGKIFICKGCGHSDDADFNASCNHEQTLPDIPHKLRLLQLNRSGFYWKENGFYDCDGVELESHLPQQQKVIV